MKLTFPSFDEKKFPDEIKIIWPINKPQDTVTLDRITGSLIGLAIGDALGASVEFRPQSYLAAHPVTDMMAGGTWGLKAGQWTDDTSMALCLASSLITENDFNPYDQLVRYKWWYKHGYLSSTGHCFDIGTATRASLEEFYDRQMQLKREFGYKTEYEIDQLPLSAIKNAKFNVNCSKKDAAGNGALMRLAPVPLFFYQTPQLAVEFSGQSARLTHGDDVAFDACRYYGALIVAAVKGETKDSLLSNQFYSQHRNWFGSVPLHKEIIDIASGSFKRPGGYEDGIRGKGHIVPALQAALWAFWSADTFEKGALNAVNLGDDTDTTAAIFGQLAGAYYGYRKIPSIWIETLYANRLIICIAEWIHYLGYPSSPISKTPTGSRRRDRSLSASSIQPKYMEETKLKRSHSTDHLKKSKRKSRRNLSRFLTNLVACGSRSANCN